jgi:hypothetical protein
MTDNARTPEFSHRVLAAEIDTEPVALVVTATEAERLALALRFDLPSIERLEIRAKCVRTSARDGSGPVIQVEMEIDAATTQMSVVTLEPMVVTVAESGLITEFALEESRPPTFAAIDVAPEDIDPPEPLEDGYFDLGALAAEYFALALDPHPREDDAKPLIGSENHENDGDEGPFAALGAWRAADKGKKQ